MLSPLEWDPEYDGAIGNSVGIWTGDHLLRQYSLVTDSEPVP